MSSTEETAGTEGRVLPEALKKPRPYSMARAALRLPNDKMTAQANWSHVRVESAQKPWEDFIAAGLARQRKALPYAGAKGAVYELTELGIAAVLEKGESRGAVTVSAEADLVPPPAGVEIAPSAPAPAVEPEATEPVSLAKDVGIDETSVLQEPSAEAEVVEPADQNVVELAQVTPKLELVKAARVTDGASTASAPESLEARVLKVATSSEVPEWARKVILDLWQDLSSRDEVATQQAGEGSS